MNPLRNKPQTSLQISANPIEQTLSVHFFVACDLYELPRLQTLCKG
jgi:hypothetical protein